MNIVRQESHLTWYEVWGPIIPLLLWMNLAGTHEVFAANEAKPIQVIPHSVLIERLNGEDPLPRSRPPQRLDEDGITDAAAFFRNNQESEAHQRGRDHYRLQTLIIESFENSGRIVAVGRESVGLRADFTLKTELREKGVKNEDFDIKIKKTFKNRYFRLMGN